MRILNIQNSYHNNNLNIKNTAKPNFFKNNNDVLDINFTSLKKDEPSQEFMEAIENQDIREDIIENIIKNSNGKYRKDAEEMFLYVYSSILDGFVAEGEEITDELKENLQIATADVFEEIKQKDDSFDLTQNIPSLVMTAFNAIENKVSNYREIFDLSRMSNGKINEPFADLLCSYKVTYPEFNTRHMAYMFINYFSDPNTRAINQNAAPVVLGLFSLANARTKEETDKLYGLVSDGNGGYDYDRFEFTYQVVEDLQNTVQNEVDETNQKLEIAQINGMIIGIIGRLQSANINRYGEFNLEKALEAYEDWSESVKKTNVMYGNEGLNPIPLTLNAMEDDEENISETSVYNSSLFKLFNVLCIYHKR